MLSATEECCKLSGNFTLESSHPASTVECVETQSWTHCCFTYSRINLVFTHFMK